LCFNHLLATLKIRIAEQQKTKVIAKKLTRKILNPSSAFTIKKSGAGEISKKNIAGQIARFMILSFLSDSFIKLYLRPSRASLPALKSCEG
jgi:hypothetical protein